VIAEVLVLMQMYLSTLFGASGDSGERKLDNSGNNFELKKAAFAVECVDLGDLLRIVIRHDNTGAGPDDYYFMHCLLSILLCGI
jgi:hypothetical protein